MSALVKVNEVPGFSYFYTVNQSLFSVFFKKLECKIHINVLSYGVKAMSQYRVWALGGRGEWGGEHSHPQPISQNACL